MKTMLKTATVMMAALLFGAALAQAEMPIKAQKAKGGITFQATGAPKPPVCAQGFTVVGKKLITHEGKKWYEYTCAYQKVVTRICNPDTQVYDVKDKFVSLPSDGKSKKTKIQMSYKCYNYVPVE